MNRSLLLSLFLLPAALSFARGEVTSERLLRTTAELVQNRDQPLGFDVEVVVTAFTPRPPCWMIVEDALGGADVQIPAWSPALRRGA